VAFDTVPVAQYAHSVSLEPAGSAQIQVTTTDGTHRFQLCFYATEEFVVPQWWVGVTTTAGELVRTDVLSGANHAPADLTRWLTAVVGGTSAGELVRRAVQTSVDRSSRIAS
jgi:hypothetical protein